MMASGESIATKEMLLGNLIHQVIEKCWDNYDAGMVLLGLLENQYEVDNKKFHKCINTFYDKFANLLEPTDEIEKVFDIDEDAYILTGKMDRISGTVIYDWKSTTNPPENIDNDIQFIIYHDAYKKLYSKTPTLFYASLVTGELIKFNYNNKYANILYYDIILNMLDSIHMGKYHREGLFGYKVCNRCTFKDICFRELGEE
jgi:hypothetical protein